MYEGGGAARHSICLYMLQPAVTWKYGHNKCVVRVCDQKTERRCTNKILKRKRMTAVLSEVKVLSLTWLICASWHCFCFIVNA